ncbi:DoxX family protein [Actinoplanes hulinensis]|uniref:DoxX family protein n=1 Tax=Actinoplanes hulinensis TaxID=1144547 RepID=A0ABS7B3M3_9ACTN|nr:DoxX family protein [Actinoplanes hulinensis]MBW6435588.1 DoxX family protein [Actinoplanes hulinensis]
MRIAYWVVAVLLAVFYAYSGGKKVTQSQDQLRPMMGWVDQIPMRLVRVIGALELLGAAGLLLPPYLAMAAAVGLTLLQVGAIITHLRRGEARLIGLNIGLLASSVATAWLATAWR